jgi:hypothetical protein
MLYFLCHCQDFWTWLFIWITRRVSYKKQELLTLREYQTSPLVFFVASVLLILLVVYVILLCIFTFLVPCCDVRYEFRIKTMFGSSLPLVVCRRDHVLLCFVYVYVYWCPSFCCCSSVWLSVLCFVCLRPVSYVSTAPTQQLFSYIMAKTS